MSITRLLEMLHQKETSKEAFDQLIFDHVGRFKSNNWDSMKDIPSRYGWSFVPRRLPSNSGETGYYLQATPTGPRTRRLLSKMTRRDWVERFDMKPRVATLVYDAAIGVKHGYEDAVIQYVAKTVDQMWTILFNPRPPYKAPKAVVLNWTTAYNLPDAQHLTPSQLKAVFQIHGKMASQTNAGRGQDIPRKAVAGCK